MCQWDYGERRGSGVEIKGIFEVQGEEYSLFVENATRLTKVYLLKKKKESQCM